VLRSSLGKLGSSPLPCKILLLLLLKLKNQRSICVFPLGPDKC
jgi:hypothetical protein